MIGAAVHLDNGGINDGAKFLLVRAEWENVAAPGSFARSINFQIAHHHIPAIPEIEIDERIGHEHADSIEHVGVMVAVGDEQRGLEFLHDCSSPFPWTTN